MPSNTRLYGLIGYPLSHSFSKKHFTEKFENEGIEHCHYELFPLPSIEQLPQLLAGQPQLCGLNVTIPHKQAIIPFLDKMEPEAKAIGAVNVVKIVNGILTGYNSDAWGFEHSLRSLLGIKASEKTNIKALILGTGGASQAIRFVLEKMGIPYRFVSRTKKKSGLSYDELTPALLAEYHLIINCTPLGTVPNEDTCPPLPYHAVTERHVFYDLVYNPAETLFLKQAKEKGASTMNGLPMLHLQAERSWEIWGRDEE